MTALDAARKGEDRHGRTVTFGFTTDVPSRLRLSQNDRKRVVAGVLGQFVDPPDWDGFKAARARPY